MIGTIIKKIIKQTLSISLILTALVFLLGSETLLLKTFVPIIIIIIVYSINRRGYIAYKKSTRLQRIYICLYLLCFSLFWSSIIYGKIVNPSFKIVSLGSMAPTIQAGDRIITDKVGEIKRGMLVIYALSNEQKQILKKNNIKFRENQVGRIIGISGEEIYINNGIVYINKKRIVEKYASNIENINLQTTNIPINHFFILKDRRNLLEGDSLFFGPIEENQIKYRITEIHGPREFRFDTIFKLSIGTLILLSFFTVPLYLYKKIPKHPIVKTSLQIHICISSMFLIVIVTSLFVETGDSYDPKYFWMLPLDFYYTIFSFIKFLTISSPIALILTSLMGWIGGMVTVVELYGKFRKS